MKFFPVKISSFLLAALLSVSICSAVYADDSDSISADLDSYVYGLTAFTQRELLAMNLPKKSVAYVTDILRGDHEPVDDENVYFGGYYLYAVAEAVNTSDESVMDAYSCLGGITYDIFSELEDVTEKTEEADDGTDYTYYIVPLEELLKADVIVSTGNVSQDAMEKSLGGEEYLGIVISELPEAFTEEEADAAHALSTGFYIGTAYSELFSPIELCAYYYGHFDGIEDRKDLDEKIENVFSDTTFFRGYEKKLPDSYDPEQIENMILEGTYFFLDNPKVFDGGAFDSNGMSSWVPVFEIESGILRAESKDGEIGADSEDTETVSQVEETDSTESETVSQVEETDSTESETDSPESESTEITTESDGSVSENVSETSHEKAGDRTAFPVWTAAAVGCMVVCAVVILIISLRKKSKT